MKVKLTVEITVNVPHGTIKEKVEQYNADDPFTMADFDHDFLVAEVCAGDDYGGIGAELQEALTEMEFGGWQENDYSLTKIKVVKAE